VNDRYDHFIAFDAVLGYRIDAKNGLLRIMEV